MYDKKEMCLLISLLMLVICITNSSDICQEIAHVINEETINQFVENGVVVLRNVIDSEILQSMDEPILNAMNNPSKFHSEYASTTNGRFFGDYYMFRRIPKFMEFIFEESKSAEIAARILKSQQVNFLYDQLFLKENMTDTVTPWHQDQSYWAVNGNDVVSVWIPFDKIPKSVCPEFIAGSHLWGNGRHYIPFKFSNGEPYTTGIQSNMILLPNDTEIRSRYSSKIVSFELNIGDVLVFQGGIIHGAPANLQSINNRRALAVRWVGDDATYIKKKNKKDVVPLIPTRIYQSNVLQTGDYIRNDPKMFPVGYGKHPDAPQPIVPDIITVIANDNENREKRSHSVGV